MRRSMKLVLGLAILGVGALVGRAATAEPIVHAAIGGPLQHVTLALEDPAPQGLAENEAEAIEAAENALAAWDLPAAAEALEGAGDSVEAKVKRGVLLVYQAEYAEGEALLAEVIASGELKEGTNADEEARRYLALARGAQKALEGSVTVKSPDGLVEAVFADDKDAILAPYLFDAMARARESIGSVIGVKPDHPVRFEFLDDPTKLAMVTPLTVQNIRTTGTVGVTKYRRIMMITPRVMVFGYGWIDTAVHEYVHYVLTMRTQNQAPVWLQEGLAKLLETRWRRTTPDELDPGVAFRLHRAIETDDLVTLAEMYPSVAMLPTAERAALAYAEVETMLGLLHERKGNAGIEVLLDAVADGADAEEALSTAWGDTFDAFMREWKRVTKARTARGEDAAITGPVFKDDIEAPKDELGDVFSHLGGGRARQHARLGTLLQSRGHLDAATMQYEKARKADKRARKDAALSKRLGKLYVELDEFPQAVPLLEIAAEAEPEDPNLAAAQGRALLRAGRAEDAKLALDRAIRNNPFIPSLHCDLAQLATDESVRVSEAAQCDE
jgi:tetratricopeptide (TPR) repeat protein